MGELNLASNHRVNLEADPSPVAPSDKTTALAGVPTMAHKVYNVRDHETEDPVKQCLDS